MDIEDLVKYSQEKKKLEVEIYNAAKMLGDEVRAGDSKGDEVIDNIILKFREDMDWHEDHSEPAQLFDYSRFNPLDILIEIDKAKALRTELEEHRGQVAAAEYTMPAGIYREGGIEHHILEWGTIAKEGAVLLVEDRKENRAGSIKINTCGKHKYCNETSNYKQKLNECDGNLDYVSHWQYKIGESAENSVKFCEMMNKD